MNADSIERMPNDAVFTLKGKELSISMVGTPVKDLEETGSTLMVINSEGYQKYMEMKAAINTKEGEIDLDYSFTYSVSYEY